MGKLSYSIAINLLTNGVKNGAQQVENTFKRLGNTIRNTLGTLGLGLGFTEFGLSMINAGKEFENAMARVQAVTNATKEEFKAMSNEAKKMGANTQYSATQSANALENLVRNGLKPSQAVAMLNKTMKFAQANGIELAEAADLVTNNMNAFGLAVNQAGRETDVMSATAANSATNVLSLGEALTQAAPLARNVNASIEETNAALGTLANVGIKGSDAGTALKQFFMGLSTATPQSTKALKAYGLQIDQTTLQAKGLTGVLEEMAKSGIGKDNQALADIFGRRAFAGAASLINNYGNYSSLLGTLKGSGGTNDRMFEQGVGNMQNALKSLESAWEAFRVKMFEGEESMFLAPTQGLTKFVRYATEHLGDLVAQIAIIFGGSKLLKVWDGFKATAKGAFESTVASATQANAKMKALQRSRIQIERQMATLERQISETTGQAKVLYEQQYQLKKKELIANGAAFERAMAERNTLVEQGERMKQLSGWKLHWTQLKTGFAGVKATLASVWATAGPIALLAVITEIIFALKDFYDESQKIKNMQREYNNELKKATHTKEIAELQRLQKLYNQTKENSKERIKYEDQISAIMGKHLKGAKDINLALNERIGILKKAAEMEFYTNKSLSAQDEMTDILNKYGGDPNKQSVRAAYLKKQGFWGRMSPFVEMDMINDRARYRELSKQKARADKAAERLQSSMPVQGGGGGGDTFTPKDLGGGSKGKTDAEKAADELKGMEKDYANSLKALKLQKDKGWITESEYQKSLRELERSTYMRTQSAEYASTRESDFAKKIGALADNGKSDDMLKMYEIAERVGKAEVQYERDIQAGVKRQDELDEAMHGVYKSAIEEAASLQGLTDTQKNMVNLWKDKGVLLESVPVMSGKAAHDPSNVGATRDKTFDYKKSRKERLELDLDFAQRQLEALKERAKESLVNMTKEINDSMKNVQSLSDALKLEELKEDCKEAGKALTNNLTDGIGKINSLVSSFRNFNDVMANPDTTGVEKVLGVLDTLANTVQGIISIYETFQAIQTAINSLSAAHAAIKTEEAVATAASATAEEVATAGGTAQAAAAETQAVANKAAAVAAEQLAAANIFLAHSYIPFAGVPIAAGFVATMEGVLAGVKAASVTKAFAHGGIVEGLPFDGSLAKVSDGEIVMNKPQQKKLWNAIESGHFGGGGGTEMQPYMRNDLIYLGLKSYMKKTGKTL